MRIHLLVASAVGCLFLFGAGQWSAAQPTRPVNAALRYWMAFAMLQEPVTDGTTSGLLERVLKGQTGWDEERLGKVLDANAPAIDTMRRGTAVVDCDWGLEYELGPSTPVAHLPKARVLGRLATLAGIRAEAQGRVQEAVDTWLAGIRFSQHVAQSGSLVSVLAGNALLDANLRALIDASRTGRLNASDGARIEAAVRSLPPTTFDWGSAIRREESAVNVMLRQLANSPDPASAYRRVFGVTAPSPLDLPTSSQIESYQKLMQDIVTTLEMPPASASSRLATHDKARVALSPLLRDSIPSLSRLNETRAATEAARQRLLQAVEQRLRR